MPSARAISSIRISLASPEEIRSWSYGEVTKPFTISYRTLKPLPDGPFCEQIFGPEKDFSCSCGKYSRARHRGIVCDRCGVEVIRAAARRERMGCVELASPVAHVWFVRGRPSPLGALLDLTARELDQVLRHDGYVITSVDEQAKARLLAGGAGTELERIVDPVETDATLLLGHKEYQGLEERFPDVFEAGTGAEALLKILERIDLDKLRERLEAEVRSSSWRRRAKAARRLGIVESFRRSGSRPEWMILTVLPVLPPGLRPIVPIDDRLAVDPVTELYRRIVVRNVRLRKLLALGAPEIITRNEKRMLQEAVDQLYDNPQRSGPHGVAAEDPITKKRLQCLGDRLSGKKGRFRQNLLGKRVDYSGRSVIVVGPELKLHQCGLPKRMALELFKPFVIRELVARGVASGVKGAKRIVERRSSPDVWHILAEVIHTRPVLLNRAPTLHRLGIQAFEPVLIEGSAIQVHPLVCTAFNADFDGDQMAVHVPLSREAVAEARQIMLSTHNLLSPGSGEPIITPTLDIVLGCYYLTDDIPPADCERAEHVFGSAQEARYAYDLRIVKLRQRIRVRVPYAKPVATPAAQAAGILGSGNTGGIPALAERSDGAVTYTDEMPVSTTRTGIVPRFEEGSSAGGRGRTEIIETTVGRLLFNEILPSGVAAAITGNVDYLNAKMDRKMLKTVVAKCHELLGNEDTAEVVDNIKRMGFEFATQSGITIAVNDLRVPAEKAGLIKKAEDNIKEIDGEYEMGLITDQERYDATVEVWSRTTEDVKKTIQDQLSAYGSVYAMAISGAKGNISQITQMAGMRGLMTDPSGRIIDLPIRSSFREGLTVLEYFISTHGARKGLADTALRTADSGYLTRRLIDVSQDVIILEEDCGTRMGVWLTQPEAGVLESFSERIIGRHSAMDLEDGESGDILAAFNEEIDDARAARIEQLGLERVYVRSALTCSAKRGICRYCYGRSPASGSLVNMGEAVGIVAAQSIGEPGTQLTMRTFHTGGVARGADITSGLPRVEELFEARVPKGQALISELDGVAEIVRDGDSRRIRVKNTELYSDEYDVPKGAKLLVRNDDIIEQGAILARLPQLAAPDEVAEEKPTKAVAKSKKKNEEMPEVREGDLVARVGGRVELHGKDRLSIVYEEKEEREYAVPAASRLRIENGDPIQAGQQLTEGSLNPQDILRIMGPESVQLYLVEEVQKVYRSQGVTINDKHIEVIVRQMLRKVRVDAPGDTGLQPNDIVDRVEYEERNARVLAEGGQPAVATRELLGVTKAALAARGFLAAASFQETSRVLTAAAIRGGRDRLSGLKENVIVGQLIPARARITVQCAPRPARSRLGPGDNTVPFLDDDEGEDELPSAEVAAGQADGDDDGDQDLLSDGTLMTLLEEEL